MTTPELTPEKTISLLSKQLLELETFDGLRYKEAQDNEAGWHNLTQSIIEKFFGNPSTNLSNFGRVKTENAVVVLSRDEDVFHTNLQKSFEGRINGYKALLKSLISEIELLCLPDTEIKGAYESGDEYQFYTDLKNIIRTAKNELLIADSYLNNQAFDVYVKDIPINVNVRILGPKIDSSLQSIARMFLTSRGNKNFELKDSSSVHDRVLFVDDRCWAFGQSIKDAAKKKPTYIVEMDYLQMKKIYDDIWQQATKIL